jgi:putative transposase
VPKWRRKALFGQVRKELGAIFHELARHKECQIIGVPAVKELD